jgi:hypothetical protein
VLLPVLLPTVVIVVALVAVTLYLFRAPAEVGPGTIVLPSPPPAWEPSPSNSGAVPPASPPPPTPVSPPAFAADINRANAQQILSELKRPPEYSSVWQIEWFWDGGGSGPLERRVFAADDYTRAEIYDVERRLSANLLTGRTRVFLWAPQGGPYHPTARGNVSVEDEAGLAVYEPLLTCDPEEILSASYLVWENKPCIFVESQAAGSRYVHAWWISLENGFLLRMEKTQDGVLKYSCVLQSVELYRPSDEMFRLPDTQLVMNLD